MGLPQDTIYVIGDEIEMEFQLWQDKEKGIPWNLTDNQIRFQLNASPNTIYKATANVQGGGDDQILVIDFTNGKFIIMIPSSQSKLINLGDYQFTIQVTKLDGKPYTVLISWLRMIDTAITWNREPT